METKKHVLGRFEKSLIALLAAVLLAIPLGFAANEPENVSGLTATAINEGAIGLSWNSAKDATGGLVNHYRIYYGTTSVQTLGEGDYDNEIDTPNNNTSFVIANLEAGTTYYFSITAVDSASVESEAYSLEASATTKGGAAEGDGLTEADTISPTVVSVSAPYKTQVIVTFSEKVVLPTANPEFAFTVQEQLSSSVLEVSSATLGTDGTKVTLETASQTANVNYVVTAGVAITDKAGNPIVSGNTDSGVFLGSSLDAPLLDEGLLGDDEGAEAPATVIEPINCGTSAKCFYEYLRTCTPATMVEVKEQKEMRRAVETGQDETTCALKYQVASILDLENPETLVCQLPTDGLEARVKRVVEVEGGMLFESKEEAQELCSGTYLATFLETLDEMQSDTTPPENITNLILSFREQLEKFIVLLRWTASINSAGDLIDQILYMSLDRGKTYDNGKSLGSSKVNHEVPNLEGGKEYTFKITTKDAVGNESVGVVKSIRLPQTGVAVGLLLLVSGVGAARALKRKRK
ncbi:MAG: fibronectin type III domain-containing protein [Candidatus Peregrinibacteria bacterium]